MRTIGNILWLVLAGFWLAVGDAIAGLVLFVTIIGIPLGVASFKLALLALVPFGKTVIDADALAPGGDVYLRGPEPIR